MIQNSDWIFFSTLLNRALNSAEKSSDGAASFITSSNAAALTREKMVFLGIRTHISRVAPDWDLLKNALTTELPRRGQNNDEIKTPYLCEPLNGTVDVVR